MSRLDSKPRQALWWRSKLFKEGSGDNWVPERSWLQESLPVRVSFGPPSEKSSPLLPLFFLHRAFGMGEGEMSDPSPRRRPPRLRRSFARVRPIPRILARPSAAVIHETGWDGERECARV